MGFFQTLFACFMKQETTQAIGDFVPIVLKPRPTISLSDLDEKVRDELNNIKANIQFAPK